MQAPITVPHVLLPCLLLHAVLPTQAQLAHYMTSEFNPTLYAWGQYYAQTRPLPDTDAAPVDPAEPAGYDPCTVRGCAQLTVGGWVAVLPRHLVRFASGQSFVALRFVVPRRRDAAEYAPCSAARVNAACSMWRP